MTLWTGFIELRCAKRLGPPPWAQGMPLHWTLTDSPLGNQNWAPGPGPHAVLLCNLHLGEIDATVDLGLESHTLAVLEFLKQGFLVGFGACVFGFYWAGLFNGVCKAGCGALGPPRFCTIWPNQTPHCILVDATVFCHNNPVRSNY